MKLLARHLLIASALVSAAADAALPDAVVEASAAVVQVRALFPDGSVSSGSAVVLGPAKLVTNCHVVFGARRIELVQGERSHPAALRASDTERDLCYLEAALVQPALEPRGNLATGERIFAVGFPAGQGLRITEGWVVALHDYEGVKVIQGTAPFNPGCSGGALLDERGRLAGIITFKDPKGGPFHFALPAAWLDTPAFGERQQHSTSGARAFWQRQGNKLPYFLRAALLEAEENWAALGTLARQWLDVQPLNPGAWSALGQAYQHLGRERDAGAAFAAAHQTESRGVRNN
jgi:serine protease Do